MTFSYANTVGVYFQYTVSSCSVCIQKEQVEKMVQFLGIPAETFDTVSSVYCCVYCKVKLMVPTYA